MEFEKNKRSKGQSLPIWPFSCTQLQAPQQTQTASAWREETWPQKRDGKELEERMDKFFTLMERIKTMKILWRDGTENKRVEPVSGPVWQPTFCLEDFVGVDGELREREKKGREEQRMIRRVDGEDKRVGIESQKEHPNKSEEMAWQKMEDNNGIDLNLSL
jgi:NPR1 interacting